jgi:hypothetical protein
MSTKQRTLTVDLDNGQSIPFTRLTSAKGNTWYAVVNPTSGKPGRYGFRVTLDMIGGSLPKSLTVGGVTVPMELGASEKGQPQSKGSAPVEIDGETFQFRATFTLVSAEAANITVKAIRQGGGAAVVTSW